MVLALTILYHYISSIYFNSKLPRAQPIRHSLEKKQFWGNLRVNIGFDGANKL